MNLLKKNLVLLLALIMCLGMTACGGIDDDDIGGDWRVQGITRDGGTITRDGEDTFVWVCVHKGDATFYYDTEDQTLFGSVEYPITFGDDVWDVFQGCDFADLDGDGNSDVTMKFNNDGTELVIVWFWDTASSQFVYQPEQSQLGEYDSNGKEDDNDSELSEEDYSAYEGIWLCDETDKCDAIDITAKGNWQLYSKGEVIDEGYLWHKADAQAAQIYSHQGSNVDDGYIELNESRLTISTLGTFHFHGQSISHFLGVWYLDNELSAESYIKIDAYGSWQFYRCTSEDEGAAIVDAGTFSFDLEQGSIYHAKSAYEDKSYMVFDFDEGLLIWGDEGSYYRMETSL